MRTNGTNRKTVGTLGVLGAFLALAAGAADIRLDAKRPVRLHGKPFQRTMKRSPKGTASSVPAPVMNSGCVAALSVPE